MPNQLKNFDRSRGFRKDNQSVTPVAKKRIQTPQGGATSGGTALRKPKMRQSAQNRMSNKPLAPYSPRGGPKVSPQAQKAPQINPNAVNNRVFGNPVTAPSFPAQMPAAPQVGMNNIAMQGGAPNVAPIVRQEQMPLQQGGNILSPAAQPMAQMAQGNIGYSPPPQISPQQAMNSFGGGINPRQMMNRGGIFGLQPQQGFTPANPQGASSPFMSNNLMPKWR